MAKKGDSRERERDIRLSLYLSFYGFLVIFVSFCGYFYLRVSSRVFAANLAVVIFFRHSFPVIIDWNAYNRVISIRLSLYLSLACPVFRPNEEKVTKVKAAI